MRRGKAEAGGFRFNICVMVRDRLLFFPVKTNNFHSPDVWPTDREKGGAPFQIVNYTRSENQFKSWLLIGTLERDQGRHYSSPLPTSLIPTVFVRQTNLVRAISYYYLGSLLFGAKYFQTNVREKGCVHYLRRHLFFESRKISSLQFPSSTTAFLISPNTLADYLLESWSNHFERIVLETRGGNQPKIQFVRELEPGQGGFERKGFRAKPRIMPRLARDTGCKKQWSSGCISATSALYRGGEPWQGEEHVN